MSWQPDTTGWNPQEPAAPADPYRPAAETRYDQPYGQAAPQFQAYGQPAPAQPFGQPAPQFQAYGQPGASYGQPFGVPYGQLPGWAGPAPIQHRAASRSLLVVSGLGVGLSLLLVLGSAAFAGRQPTLQVALVVGGVIAVLMNGTVLTLTIVGRRLADQGRSGVLLAAGIVATSLGGLGVVSTLANLASGGNAGGFVGGALYLAAGIGVIRAARS